MRQNEMKNVMQPIEIIGAGEGLEGTDLRWHIMPYRTLLE
jgi:hypothetical protein